MQPVQKQRFIPCIRQDHQKCGIEFAYVGFTLECDCPCHHWSVQHQLMKPDWIGKQVAIEVQSCVHDAPGEETEGHIVRLWKVTSENGKQVRSKETTLLLGIPQQTLDYYRRQSAERDEKLLQTKCITTRIQ